MYDWIKREYPSSRIKCEVPMTYRNEHGQLLQGFINMLIDTLNGYVIVDHKTHPTDFDSKDYAAGCAAQLNAYKLAVEKATAKPVLSTIIHLPLIGECYEVKPK